jgi:hypothetical protein
VDSRVRERQEIFRDVNRSIVSMASAGDTSYPFLCECGLAGCTATFDASTAELGRVLDDAELLVVTGPTCPRPQPACTGRAPTR